MKERRTYKQLLDTALASFDNDPPDSDFQRGYLTALEDLRADMERKPRPPRQ